MDRLEPREELCEPALCSANVVEDRAREEEEVAEFAASGPLDELVGGSVGDGEVVVGQGEVGVDSRGAERRFDEMMLVGHGVQTVHRSVGLLPVTALDAADDPGVERLGDEDRIVDLGEQALQLASASCGVVCLELVAARHREQQCADRAT
jgi:hypothetical protein